MSSKPRRNETKERHATPSQEAETGETSPGRSARDEKNGSVQESVRAPDSSGV